MIQEAAGGHGGDERLHEQRDVLGNKLPGSLSEKDLHERIKKVRTCMFVVLCVHFCCLLLLLLFLLSFVNIIIHLLFFSPPPPLPPSASETAGGAGPSPSRGIQELRNAVGTHSQEEAEGHG